MSGFWGSFHSTRAILAFGARFSISGLVLAFGALFQQFCWPSFNILGLYQESLAVPSDRIRCWVEVLPSIRRLQQLSLPSCILLVFRGGCESYMMFELLFGRTSTDKRSIQLSVPHLHTYGHLFWPYLGTLPYLEANSCNWKVQ